MKWAIIVSMMLSALLAGCNSVGPYYGAVYKLDASVYQVSLNTWIGRGNGWPKGNDELKRKAEREAIAALRRLGFPVETCAFRSFIPFEGGHMTISLLAGEKSAVAILGAMPKDRFVEELRKTASLPVVPKFYGRFPEKDK